MKKKRIILGVVLAFALALTACTDVSQYISTYYEMPEEETPTSSWQEQIPAYAGEASVYINDNIPFFTPDEITADVFEEYAPLDGLGRCGAAFANVCREIMPTEKRGNIGSVKPTGWQTAKYDLIAEQYLYNRCHLIGFQLAGENANAQNLITGTRYLNIEGMLPWENLVAKYVEETDNHVLYRASPYFEGENLLAYGVLIEAYSVEDEGEGVCFNVYCYNVQPGIIIDYATGDSCLDETWVQSEADYILNTNTKKFHLPSCTSAQEMSDANREYFVGDRESLIKEGYTPCGRCNP